MSIPLAILIIFLRTELGQAEEQLHKMKYETLFNCVINY